MRLRTQYADHRTQVHIYMTLYIACSLVPRPSASRARIAYVTFEPLSDSWQGFKGHVCDARATGRRPENEATLHGLWAKTQSLYCTCICVDGEGSFSCQDSVVDLCIEAGVRVFGH